MFVLASWNRKQWADRKHQDEKYYCLDWHHITIMSVRCSSKQPKCCHCLSGHCSNYFYQKYINLQKVLEELAAIDFFLKFSSIKSIHFELVLEKCTYSTHGRKICRRKESRKPRRDETIWEYLMKVRRIILKRMPKKCDRREWILLTPYRMDI